MTKKDLRGLHGRQGRKATGRVRDKPFSGKFTEAENKEIRETAKTFNMSQSDVVLKGVRKLNEKGE